MREHIQTNGGQSARNITAGLPKAIKLSVIGQNQTMTLNTAVALLWNTVLFNYGGYVTHTSPILPPNFDGIVIPEPGIYEVQAQMQQSNGGQIGQLNLTVNGSSTLPDGTLAGSGAGAAEGAGFPSHSASTSLELRQGDVVGASCTSFNFSVQTLPLWQWIYVGKMGGRY